MNICVICGRPAEATHHWIFGSSLRGLADEDKIYSPVCNSCHTMGRYRIHDNPIAEHLSKMLGQMMYERNKVASGCTLEEAREAFMSRYGRNYL